MNRATLPNRRPNVTLKREHRGAPVFITIGYGVNAHGRFGPVEAFGDAAKSGSDFSELLSDACVVVSIALQSGVEPQAMAKSLGRAPAQFGGGDRPASVIGLIVDALMEEA